MDEQEERQKKLDGLIEELRVKMQEWIHLTDEGPDASIMTGCVIAFESSRFDESGNQMYRTDYLSLPPTSISQMVGLINITNGDLNHRMFGHCGEH
jgi:hypothetical protein